MNLSFNKKLHTIIFVNAIFYISNSLGRFESPKNYEGLSKSLSESFEIGSIQPEPKLSLLSRLSGAPSIISDVGRSTIETIGNISRKLFSFTFFYVRNHRQNLISKGIYEIESYIYHLRSTIVDGNQAEAEIMILLKEKIPVLIKMIEAQVHIIPDNVQGMYIGDVIQALLKIDLHKSEIHSDFIVKASITFQLYAVYILKEANLELDNLRTSLLIDLMRIFCAIFGHEGTLKLTESNKILTLLAKGFHSIIEDLFDRGEIKNLWKLESYKTLCAYSQAHPLTFIFRNIYRFGNKNTWDSLLNEYMTLEFKSLNNREINNLLEDILPLSKLSCKPEEEKKKIVNTLLHNLLNVKSLPPLSEIQNTPGKVRVYFSLRWLSKYLMEENELSVEDNPHNQNYQIFRYLRGFILIYSNERNIINLKNSFGFDKIAKYFLSKHARIETGTKPKASIYKLHEDYNAYLQKYRRYLDTYFFA